MSAPVSVLGGLAKDQRPWPDIPLSQGPQLLLDINFTRKEGGAAGFGPLNNSQNPTGIIGYTPNGQEGGGALTLNTCNAADSSTAGFAHSECYAYRRSSRYATQTGVPFRVKLETWWSYMARYGATNFGKFEIGVDQANSAGVRYYPNLRWFNSEDNTNLDQRWYVNTGSPTSQAYTLIPGPDSGTASGSAFTGNIQTNLGFNENKHNDFYTALVYEVASDSSTLVYDGFQVQHRTFGSLAGLAKANNPLRALATTSSTLAPFSFCMNVGIGIRNRTTTSNAASEALIHRVRVTVLPAAV